MNPFNKYVIFSVWGEGVSVAWHLQNAGKQVIFAMLEDISLIGLKETPDEKRRRMMIGKGIFNTKKAETFVETMQKWPDKDEWFIFFDFNNQWKLAKELKDFPYGNFPTKFDFTMEGDRDSAKEVVKKYYPGVRLAEVEQFKSAEDAAEFLEESEEFWALKANSPDGKTVVPKTKDLMFAKREIMEALNASKPEYESKGFILERQIRDGLEVCTEGHWWDGELVSVVIDLENKMLGAGNTGFQVGCAGNLIHEIPMGSELAKLALPEIIQKEGKKRRGLWIADANFIIKDGDLYYLECGFRPGYDSFMTELEMAGGASFYFDSLFNGEPLFKSSFGVGIRGFNLKKEHDLPEGGTKIGLGDAMEHIWPYGLFKADGNFMDSNYTIDAILATGASDDPEYAAMKAYQVLESCSYDCIYYRPIHDWLSTSYPGNISTRLEGLQRLTASPDG